MLIWDRAAYHMPRFEIIIYKNDSSYLNHHSLKRVYTRHTDGKMYTMLRESGKHTRWSN